MIEINPYKLIWKCNRTTISIHIYILVVDIEYIYMYVMLTSSTCSSLVKLEQFKLRRKRTKNTIKSLIVTFFLRSLSEERKWKNVPKHMRIETQKSIIRTANVKAVTKENFRTWIVYIITSNEIPLQINEIEFSTTQTKIQYHPPASSILYESYIHPFFVI